MDFDLVLAARKNGRTAATAEKSPVVIYRCAVNGHCILREHCGCIKNRPVMLAAIKAVADANPQGWAGCRKPDVTAKATACKMAHFVSPSINKLSDCLQRTPLGVHVLAVQARSDRGRDTKKEAFG